MTSTQPHNAVERKLIAVPENWLTHPHSVTCMHSDFLNIESEATNHFEYVSSKRPLELSGEPKITGVCKPAKRKKNRSPTWTPVEEVFLTGIVMDTYRRNHSLKPADSKTSRMKDQTRGYSIWDGIHQRYYVALQRHHFLTGELLPRRTMSAIRKRWKRRDKTQESQVDDHGCFLVTIPATRDRELVWETEYNVEERYTCPERIFRQRFC